MVDNLIQEGLKNYSLGNATAKDVFEILANSTRVDSDGNGLFPGTDMTKETSYDVVETMSKISGVNKSDLWQIYDEVYNEYYEQDCED